MTVDAFADIVDLLPELEVYLRDQSISEVMVNADGSVHIERAGRMEMLAITVDNRKLGAAVHQFAAAMKEWIGEERPLLVARLVDGSRVAAAWMPVSVGGITLSIRKFPTQRYGASDLVEMGSMSQGQLDVLAAAVESDKNILISGGTGTGKTSLVNALAEFIPAEQRILLIEDIAEIVLPADKTNVVRFEARKAQDGMAAVTIRNLVEHALRMRPDRLILGEVRGAEAFDLLQVLNSGHAGSLSTIHANSATKAVERLTSLALIAGVMEPAAVRGEIGTSIDLLVHLARRRDGKRVVSEILTMDGYDYAAGKFVLVGAERKPVERAGVVEFGKVAQA